MASNTKAIYLRGDACPFCEGRRLRPFVAGRTGHRDARPVQLLECRDCVAAWQWPLERTSQESIEHYDDCYSQADKAECSYFHEDRRNVVADLQLAFLRELVGKCEGRLIDVGAGDGAFVQRALLAGFDSYGIEPSPFGSDAANKRLGEKRVVCGRLPNPAIDGKYDIVTLWDVIEHIEDPLDLLRSAVALLRPGGWLVVETGNYQSADRLLAGENWWAYHPEHRWYFTPQVMASMLQRAGINETKLCDHTLRVNSPKAISASLVGAVRSSLRRPWVLPNKLRRYNCMRQATSHWPEWAHLSIFALAGRIA
jgi:2-polyprenyl-3-methyl-5-hydroxy-6-metoxy-1,4-benzoquinol methylase